MFPDLREIILPSLYHNNNAAKWPIYLLLSSSWETEGVGRVWNLNVQLADFFHLVSCGTTKECVQLGSASTPYIVHHFSYPLELRCIFFFQRWVHKSWINEIKTLKLNSKEQNIMHSSQTRGEGKGGQIKLWLSLHLSDTLLPLPVPAPSNGLVA